MLVKMAKEKIKPEIKKVEIPEEEKQRFFPKLLILFGLVLTAWALNGFFNWLAIPELATNIVLLLAGLWVLKVGIAKGFYRKRKEGLKKYI